MYTVFFLLISRIHLLFIVVIANYLKRVFNKSNDIYNENKSAFR